MIAKPDGSTVTYKKSGQVIYEFPDGTRKQINPDGSTIMVDTAGIVSMTPSPRVTPSRIPERARAMAQSNSASSPRDTPGAPNAASEFTPETLNNAAPIPAFKKIDPKQLFEQHLQDAKNAGIKISSQKKRKGTRKVMFKDGGKLMLSKDGVMIHKYADGKKVQCTPDGKHITVRWLVSLRLSPCPYAALL